MNLSPTFVETEPLLSDIDLSFLLLLLLVILTIAAFIRARTPAFIAVVFFWPAMMLGTYLILVAGFSWPIFMISLMVIISALAIWKGLKDDKLSPYLGAVALIGVFLFSVIFLGGGGEMISEEIGGNGDGISIPWDDPSGYIETTFGGFGTLLLIILVGGILAFLLVQRVIPIIKSSSESKEDEEKLEDQLSSTVDSAVKELREGKDIYSTILRCYQRMCWILEEEGAKNFEFMTPREFEKQAIRTLDVSISRVTEIREVFELAKYSNHQLGKEERERALKALKGLRKELK